MKSHNIFKTIPLIVLITFCVLRVAHSQCQSQGNFIGYGVSCGDTEGSAIVTVSVPVSNLVYLGKSYTILKAIQKTVSIIFGDSTAVLTEVYSSFPNTRYPRDPDFSMVAVFHAYHEMGGSIQKFFYRVSNGSGDTQMANITDIINSALFKTNTSWAPAYAAVFTWTNAPFHDCRTTCSNFQNSYQLVITWDSTVSYAILNYGDIKWYQFGSQDALAGFNWGDGTGWTPLPVNVTTLAESFGSDVKGRYIYRISGDKIERIGCLSISGTSTQMKIMGGDIILVSETCLQSIQDISGFKCVFSKVGTNNEVQAKIHSVNVSTLACITPRVWNTGVYRLKLTDTRTGSLLEANFTFVAPDKVSTPIITILNMSKVFLREIVSDGIIITWDPTTLNSESRVSLSILGYGENNSNYELVQLGKVDIPNEGTYTITTSMTCTVPQCANHHIGFITLSTYSTPERTIWSPLIPLGYLVNNYMISHNGATWADDMCGAATKATFDWAVIKCPCYLSQAEGDIKLTKTSYCPRLPNSNCSSASKPQECFTHIAPYINANPASAMCCYDRSTGTLMYSEDTSYSKLDDHGSYTTLIHKDAQAPVFSQWYKDILPFLYCCRWNVKASTCAQISKIRPTPDCEKFTPGMPTFCGRPNIGPAEINNTNYQVGQKVTVTNCFFVPLAAQPLPLFLECNVSGNWIPSDYNNRTCRVPMTTSRPKKDYLPIIIGVSVAVIILILLGTVVGIVCHRGPKIGSNGMSGGTNSTAATTPNGVHLKELENKVEPEMDSPNDAKQDPTTEEVNQERSQLTSVVSEPTTSPILNDSVGMDFTGTSPALPPPTLPI